MEKIDYMKDKLIKAVKENNQKLIYINLNERDQYNGWTSNFNFKLPSGEDMKLDLKVESDLFLLFVLASSWSKTGPWENAAMFTAYLKLNNKGRVNLWLDEGLIEDEIKNKDINSKLTIENCIGIQPRKKVSFRKDYY